MDCLARREHSFYELKQKLLLKYSDADPAMVIAVLDRLREEKLQSDARFAEGYIRHRKNRGFGYRYIRADLARRHVNQEVIDKLLFSDDSDWSEIARQLVDRRLGEAGRVEWGSREHRRLLRFLESRGFSALEISRSLAQRMASSGVEEVSSD